MNNKLELVEVTHKESGQKAEVTRVSLPNWEAVGWSTGSTPPKKATKKPTKKAKEAAAPKATEKKEGK